MRRKTTAMWAVPLVLVAVCVWAQGASTPDATLTTPPPDKMDTNVVKVLRTTNKAQVNQYICKVFEVRNCNPYEIVNFPELLAEAEEGMIYTFIHPDGDKGKILVTCPSYQMPYFEKLIPELDRPKITSAPGSKYILYRGKNRTALCLAGLARYYGGSQDIFFPDVETNSVLCFGVPSGCDAAAAAMDAADVPSAQLLLEVTIYEAKLNNDGAFGFDFHAWKNGPGRALFGAGARYQWLGVHGVDYDGASAHGQGFFLDYPSAYFDFLVEKGKAKVLTSTRLTTMNNQLARFSTSEDVLFYHVTQDDVIQNAFLDRKVTGATQPRSVDAHGLPLASTALAAGSRVLGLRPPQVVIQPVSTGVFLDVLPVINRELIELGISARVVTLVGYDDAGQPILSSRQFDSNVHTPPGSELVIGGLTRERKAKTTRKVPILGSIPVLGFAFGGEISQTEKTMVVTVIRPLVDGYDSPVRPEDQILMSRANGAEPIPMPATPYGFDQWLLDRDQ